MIALCVFDKHICLDRHPSGDQRASGNSTSMTVPVCRIGCWRAAGVRNNCQLSRLRIITPGGGVVTGAAGVIADDRVSQRHVLGPNHPDTLRSAHHLAVDLRLLADHHRARQLHADTLGRQPASTRRRSPRHPVLGEPPRHQSCRAGQHHQARQLHHDTLTRRRVLGFDWPPTCTRWVTTTRPST